jgi:hypothetical protein
VVVDGFFVVLLVVFFSISLQIRTVW